MRPLLAICLLAAMTLSACVNVHPRYPADAVVWDPSLLGNWHAVGEDGQTITLRVDAREIVVSPDDDRINPDDVILGHSRAGADHTINQYLLTYTTAGNDVWALEGYLLKARGRRFLAFQRTDPFIDDNAGWVLPVHMLWKIEHSGDHIQFWSPTDAVAWIPAIQWADAEDDGGDRPIPRRNPDNARRGIRVAESLDRVLEYHARHASDPTFWNADDQMRFQRVDGAASPVVAPPGGP